MGWTSHVSRPLPGGPGLDSSPVVLRLRGKYSMRAKNTLFHPNPGPPCPSNNAVGIEMQHAINNDSTPASHGCGGPPVESSPVQALDSSMGAQSPRLRFHLGPLRSADAADLCCPCDFHFLIFTTMAGACFEYAAQT